MVMVVDMKVFILSTCLTTLNTGELVVNHTVDGKDNQEEKPMEVADILGCITLVGIFFKKDLI